MTTVNYTHVAIAVVAGIVVLALIDVELPVAIIGAIAAGAVLLL